MGFSGGTDYYVISPPANDTTVIGYRCPIAVGAQYRTWKAIHLGVDGRFRLVSSQMDTMNRFDTAGAYVGMAF